MKTVIVCNGRIRDYKFYKKYFEAAELVICTDGAAAHMRKFGIMPHILMGDFDSITDSDLQYYTGSGVETLRFPIEKDMTDTELAIETAVEKGSGSIVLIGAVGTRIDHSMANIFLLKKANELGVEASIVDEFNEINLICRSIVLEREENTRITLLPLSESVEGVTTKGLYYPLDNASIKMGSTWGVSNEFSEDTAEVSIKSGLLLVVKSKD